MNKVGEILKKREQLKELIARLSNGKELIEPAISDMSIFCIAETNKPACIIYEPCLCVAAQGSKLVSLADERYVYDDDHYLLASLNLPTMAQVLRASRQKPYYGFKLNLNPSEIAQIMLEGRIEPKLSAESERGMAIGKIDLPLLDAVCRMVSLLDTPADIPVLAPIIRKEIIYRLLSGTQGAKLAQLASIGSPTNRMAAAVSWLRNNFKDRTSIESLAEIAKMSVSAFHKHFREMTAMSPLQYQKLLRLQEAKRMMISDGLDVASAAFNVGYESATQFNREYKRMFGEPPRRDVSRGLAGA